MPRFATTTEIPTTPNAAFAYIVTLSNWPVFRGFGPLPGIAHAEVPDGSAIALGTRVRVTNTDGSVHHERVTAFEPPLRYGVRMELGKPASAIMASIDEAVELEATATGTRMRRRFVVQPKAWFTAPVAWLVAYTLLRPAVRNHDRAVTAALSARA